MENKNERPTSRLLFPTIGLLIFLALFLGSYLNKERRRNNTETKDVLNSGQSK